MHTLEIDRISRTFGQVRALHELSFDVRGGEIFGFVGANGAGKTTAMRIILGVLAADAGEVRWDGVRLDLAQRRRVGYMPEERGLYPRMKVGAQLRFLAGLHGLDPREAAVAVDRWTERLGVEERREDPVEKLSLGNQQRVQLAAALVHDPDVLVLDEPFSGLDPVAVDVMSDVLREQAAGGVPVIFSSHQLDLVERLCDRVGIIRAGQMEALGTIDELRGGSASRWRLVVPPEEAAAVRGVLGGDPSFAAAEGDRPGVFLLDPADGAEGANRALAEAVAVTRVVEFGALRPSLTELFRDVVAAPAPAQGESEMAEVAR